MSTESVIRSPKALQRTKNMHQLIAVRMQLDFRRPVAKRTFRSESEGLSLRLGRVTRIGAIPEGCFMTSAGIHAACLFCSVGVRLLPFCCAAIAVHRWQISPEQSAPFPQNGQPPVIRLGKVIRAVSLRQEPAM